MLARVLKAGILIGILASCYSFLIILSVSAEENISVGVGVGDTVLDLSGQSSPNAFISVYSGSNLIGTMTADNGGDFSQSIVAQAPGITRITVSGRDTANHLTDAVTLEVNLEEHSHTSVHVFLPTSLILEASALQNTQALHLNGQTYPNSNLTVFIDNVVAGTIIAAPNGLWNAQINTRDLSNGLHGVFARVNDSLGSQSFSTQTQSFTIIRPSAVQPLPIPTTPSITPIIKPVPLAPKILSPSEKQVFKQSRIIVTGQGPARSQIEISEGSTVIGSVISDFSGTWSLPYTFTEGEHAIRARSCDINICSSFSNQVAFTYRASSTNAPRLRVQLEKHTFTVIRPTQSGETTLRLRITEGTPLFQIGVDWGDNKKSSFTSSSRDVTIKHTYTKDGKFIGRVMIRNPLGSQELFFTVIVDSKQPDTYTLLPALAILALIGWSLIRLIYPFRLSKVKSS